MFGEDDSETDGEENDGGEGAEDDWSESVLDGEECAHEHRLEAPERDSDGECGEEGSGSGSVGGGEFVVLEDDSDDIGGGDEQN